MRNPAPWRAIVIAGVVSAGLALTAGTAVAQKWKGSSSPEDLLYRLQILDAEIADIRARLGGGGGGGATRPLTGTGNAAVEGELRRLTGQIERIEQAQRALRADLQRRLGDIEYRLNELEGVSNEDTGGTAPLDGSLDRTNDRVAAAPVGAAERSDLNRAINDVEKGRFDQGEDRLRRFINSYGGSPLSGEAWYWLGESLFVRGIHAEAAKSYLNGYQSNRKGAHAPHNLYRLGVTLGRLGQINEACLTLFEVRKQFPNAPDGIAGKADRELDNLACG